MWAPFEHDTKNNPKTKALAKKLGLPVFAACGLLALLWSWATSKAEGSDGLISEYRTKAIEDACGWNGQRGKLLVALQECGFIDGETDNDDDPLRIHDWADYNNALIKKRENNRIRKQRERARKKGLCASSERDVSRVTVTPPTVNSLQSTGTITNTEEDESSYSSISPECPRNQLHVAHDLYDYWERIFPEKQSPGLQIFIDLLEQGFEPDAIYWMIDLTLEANARYPDAYFNRVYIDKINRGLYTKDAIRENKRERDAANAQNPRS